MTRRWFFAFVAAVSSGACSQVFVTDGSTGGDGGASSSGVGAAPTSAVSIASSGSVGPASGITVVASSSTGPDVPTCPSFNEPCTSCIATECPATWCDCQGNAECFELFKCTGQCMDAPGCFDQCMAQHPDGIAALLAVSGCAGTTCDGSCPWGDEEHTPCAGCVFKDCATETNACFSDGSCLALWKCFDGCGPQALSCHKQCYDAHPDGIAKLEALLSCANATCDAVCD